MEYAQTNKASDGKYTNTILVGKTYQDGIQNKSKKIIMILEAFRM